MKELRDELEDSRVEEFKKKGVKYYSDQKAQHARFRKCLEHRITLVYASGLMTDVIIADGQRLQETLKADDIPIDVKLFQCPCVVRWRWGGNPLTPLWLVVDTVLEQILDLLL